MAPATFLLQKLKNLPESAEDVDAVVRAVAPEVCRREVTLQEVVEALGPSLTHERPREREVGTHVLAGLLGQLPAAHLSATEAAFMTAFLVDRLRDHHTVQPAVFLSLLALVKQERLGEAEVLGLVEGVFREVQVQAHTVADRRTLYSVFKYCICNRASALKGLGLSLLPGLVEALEGERDPRNLVVVFSIVKAFILSGLPLQPFVEELFEVMAAYFPVDFLPARGDPYAIRVEDLVVELRGVLAATPLFAPFCLPLLHEKLDSDLTSAKLDALHTLVACCAVYSAEDLHPHTRPLWSSLCREVMEGASKEVEEAALSALIAVVSVLEAGLTTTASRAAAAALMQEVFAECESHLEAPEQRLMWPSTRLLVALVVAAPGPAAAITARVVPQLTRQFVRSDGTELACQNTMSALAMVLEAAAKHSHMLLEGGALSKLAGQVWEAFRHGLCSDGRRQVQAATLAALPAVLPALPSPFLQLAAQTLTTRLMDASAASLREGIKTCLVRLGQHNPEVILKHTLPPLLATLHPGGEPCDGSEEQVLEMLASLAVRRAVLAPVLTAVWGCAETLLAGGDMERCHRYLSTVDKVVGGCREDTESEQYLLQEWQGTRQILTMFTRLIRHSHPPHTPALLCLASTLRTLVAMDSKPEPLVQHVVSLAVQGTQEHSGGTDTLLLPDSSPEMTRLLASPLDFTDPIDSNMLYALEGVVSGAQSLPQESTDLQQLLRKVRVFHASTGDPGLREAAVVLHATAVNKLQQGAQLSQVLEARQGVEAALEPSQPQERRLAALHLTTWTCKALVVCGSNLQDWWTTKLLDLLGDPALGVAAAASFETVVKEHPRALRPAGHTRIRLLHRQRFFEGVVGPLVETFNTAQGPLRTCCQVALCSLMPHLPQPVLAPHVAKVLPVVLQGVAGREGQVGGVVETLAALLHQSPAPATTHLAFLLPALLALTSTQPMAVRLKALECLDALATLPTTPLLPYRDHVLRGLKGALNDHKRFVRRAAANTRTVWIMVGAPGGS